MINYEIILGSIYIAITFFAFNKRIVVKFPVPGPIYNIVSVGNIPAFSTIEFKILLFLRICCPISFLYKNWWPFISKKNNFKFMENNLFFI